MSEQAARGVGVLGIMHIPDDFDACMGCGQIVAPRDTAGCEPAVLHVRGRTPCRACNGAGCHSCSWGEYPDASDICGSVDVYGIYRLAERERLAKAALA